MGVGLAGAVAGAAMGVAFADDKTRRRIYKLAKNAQTSLMSLIDVLEIPDYNLAEKVDQVMDEELPARSKMLAKGSKKVRKNGIKKIK
jgi:enoyl-[acyl-carrier-protein] reductase (NADH)